MLKLFDTTEIKPMWKWTVNTWSNTPILDKLNLVLFWVNFVVFYGSLLFGICLIVMTEWKLGLVTALTGIIITKLIYAIHGHSVFSKLMAYELDSQSVVIGHPINANFDPDRVEKEMMS